MEPLSLDQLKEELARIFPDEEAKKVEVDEANLSKVASLVLKSEDDAVLASLTEVVGDLARIDENRERLGAIEGVLERLVAILVRAQDVPLQKWTARALGNLSYEHEESIDKIIAAGAVPRLIELMASGDMEVKRNSTGALANISSVDHAKELVVEKGALPVVFDLLRSDNETVQMMAYRVITNLGDNENNRVEIVKAGGLKLLVDFVLKNEDESTTVEALNALCVLVENKQHAIEFAKEGGLKALVPLVGDDESETAQATAADLLHTLATIDELKTWFLAEGLIAPLLKLAKSDEVTTRKKSIKIIAQLVLNDEVANSLFQEADLLLDLLKSEDPEIQLHTTMIIGNIARSDENCVKLVDAGAAQLLGQLLLVKDPRLQQLAAGALRNLAIPAQNKAKVAESGVFPGLIACLSSTNAHAMFAAIGAIKALLVTPENRRKFIALEGLEAIIRIKDAIIIDATQQDDPDAARKPKDQRIQYEAARTLAVLTEEESARDEIVRLGGVGLLHFLLDSSFEILQNEGLRALRHLVHHREAESRPKLVEDGLIDVVLNGLTKTKSDDVVLGLVALLSALADNDKFREELVAKNADSVLVSLTASPAQTEASQTLRAKIGPTSNP